MCLRVNVFARIVWKRQEPPKEAETKRGGKRVWVERRDARRPRRSSFAFGVWSPGESRAAGTGGGGRGVLFLVEFGSEMSAALSPKKPPRVFP